MDTSRKKSTTLKLLICGIHLDTMFKIVDGNQIFTKNLPLQIHHSRVHHPRSSIHTPALIYVYRNGRGTTLVLSLMLTPWLKLRLTIRSLWIPPTALGHTEDKSLNFKVWIYTQRLYPSDWWLVTGDKRLAIEVLASHPKQLVIFDNFVTSLWF